MLHIASDLSPIHIWPRGGDLEISSTVRTPSRRHFITYTRERLDMRSFETWFRTSRLRDSC